MISPDQPPLLTIEDVVGELSPDEQRDVRAYIGRRAMELLAMGYEITNNLVDLGEEEKSRKKHVEVPQGWLEVER